MNKDSGISEREFEIINIIASGTYSSQRDISGSTGMSLGMTNLLLRRLVTKGYLRAQQLNRKKVKYLLTPSGFSEKAKKTYLYTLKTIRSLFLLKSQIQAILQHQMSLGHYDFALYGKGDLQDLVELVSRDALLKAIRLVKIPDGGAAPSSNQVLLYVGPTSPWPDKKDMQIDLTHALFNPDSPIEENEYAPANG